MVFIKSKKIANNQNLTIFMKKTYIIEVDADKSDILTTIAEALKCKIIHCGYINEAIDIQKKRSIYNEIRILYAAMIIKEFKNGYGIGLDRLSSESREHDLVVFRYIFAKYCNKIGFSPTELGRILHRDHASIYHYLREFKTIGLKFALDNIEKTLDFIYDEVCGNAEDIEFYIKHKDECADIIEVIKKRIGYNETIPVKQL